MSNQYGKKIGFEDIHTTLFTQISRPKENRRHVKHKVVQKQKETYRDIENVEI